MAYKKTFTPNTIIKSAEINENAKITNNDATASVLMWVIGEDLTSQVPGSSFTIAHQYQPNSIGVYVDGIRLTRITDFTETSSTTIAVVVALIATQEITVDYIRKDI